MLVKGATVKLRNIQTKIQNMHTVYMKLANYIQSAIFVKMAMLLSLQCQLRCAIFYIMIAALLQ